MGLNIRNSTLQKKHKPPRLKAATLTKERKPANATGMLNKILAEFGHLSWKLQLSFSCCLAPEVPQLACCLLVGISASAGCYPAPKHVQSCSSPTISAPSHSWVCQALASLPRAASTVLVLSPGASMCEAQQWALPSPRNAFCYCSLREHLPQVLPYTTPQQPLKHPVAAQGARHR